MKIIVSYRRSDSSATAGRIYDHLVNRFGQNSVFMDVDAIPFGTDFRTHIKSALLGSDVLLAVIGPNWLGQMPDGSRRVDDEADPVRVEVETALANGVTVVPVLIDGTAMPGASQLPAAVKDLAFLNAAPVDMGRDFRPHADRLVRALETILAAKAGEPGAGSAPIVLPPPSPPAAAKSGRSVMIGLGGLCLAALLAAGGWFALGSGNGRLASPARPPEAPKPMAASEPRPVAPAPPAQPATPPPTPSAPPVVQPAASPVPAAPAPAAEPAPIRAAEPAPAPSASPPPVPVVTLPAPVQAPPPNTTTPAPSTIATRVAAAATNRSRAHGTFAWYELWTTNAPAAQTFYRSVLGWNGATTGTGAGAYTILSAGQAPVAGLATLPANLVAQGVKPAWIGYVTVTNVDASVNEAKNLGAALYLGPADIPGIGRYALIADPQGGTVALFKGLADPPPTSAEVPLGHAGWRELRTANRGAASDFYGRLFGWAKSEAGEGPWQLAQGGTTIGAIQSDGATGAAWTFMFQVADLTSAMVRVVAGGGKVVGQPRQITGSSWVVSCTDPQGAAFALMSRTR